ncbi:hypothetical protein Y032_0015g2662 [Ancylostoma ceylanicum]|uniref:Uncharacterized protein n=1 Tax=Ancylostoma ceylanicum TaxID=53326 RepID=A0A016V871_9BILA|nr:hypothetical protein Y032_0015g2662 [Ancylostoma ceylanicum]
MLMRSIIYRCHKRRQREKPCHIGTEPLVNMLLQVLTIFLVLNAFTQDAVIASVSNQHLIPEKSTYTVPVLR